jgi:hypothetical protein
VRHSAGEPTDGLQLLRLKKLSLGAPALLHLVREQRVRTKQLVGALAHALFELALRAPELLLHPLAREEVGDRIRARACTRGRARRVFCARREVPFDVCGEAVGVRHQEAAHPIPLGSAEDLARDERDAEALFAPA